MASRTLAVSPRRSIYVCDSCLSNAQSLRAIQATTPRTISTASFSTASSRTCGKKSQRTSLHIRHVRQSKAVVGIRHPTANQLAPTRSYATETSPTQAIATGIALLPHRCLISLSGHDAAKFLHGLITNNVDSTRVSPFYSAFLDARGRVLWDVFVWVWPELVAKEGHWACYIEVDASEAEALKKHLKKHKLRSKLTIKDAPVEGPEGVKVWAAWGGAHKQVKEWSEVAGFEDPRAPGMFRYLANADRETIADGLQPVDVRYYNIQRYIHGVPEGPEDMPRESTLPMEANIDLNGGIDFKKGCYVGQELTIRTKHTGVVRKRILPIRLLLGDATGVNSTNSHVDLSFTPQPLSGMDIKVLDDTGAMKKGRATGKIIAAIGNVGLATCRLENMTAMRVSAEGGTYKEGMQFGVEVDGQIVKVGPVLHDWFVKRKEALWDKEERKKSRIAEEQEELD